MVARGPLITTVTDDCTIRNNPVPAAQSTECCNIITTKVLVSAFWLPINSGIQYFVSSTCNILSTDHCITELTGWVPDMGHWCILRACWVKDTGGVYSMDMWTMNKWTQTYGFRNLDYSDWIFNDEMYIHVWSDASLCYWFTRHRSARQTFDRQYDIKGTRLSVTHIRRLM